MSSAIALFSAAPVSAAVRNGGFFNSNLLDRSSRDMLVKLKAGPIASAHADDRLHRRRAAFDLAHFVPHLRDVRRGPSFPLRRGVGAKLGA
jgi:hypothetical protein